MIKKETAALASSESTYFPSPPIASQTPTDLDLTKEENSNASEPKESTPPVPKVVFSPDQGQEVNFPSFLMCLLILLP